MRKRGRGVSPWRAILVSAAVLAGCAGGEGSAGESSAEVGAKASPVEALPAALLGMAPAPRGEAVGYFPEDPATRGYLVVPEGDGPFPAVILIHEWRGLTDRIRQVADALAAEGYVALAADLYSGKTGESREENFALMQGAIEGGRIVANLDAAARFLRGRPDVTGKIATIGWCFGGGVALSYAIGGEHHEGTAIFYGRLVDDPEKLASIHHEIYGTFAGLDQDPSREEVGRFVDALRKAGIPNDVHIYDEVNHGFWLWVDEDPETRAAPAADAWNRLKAYLARTLKG
jgi:carboxymethylenebutenolidase